MKSNAIIHIVVFAGLLGLSGTGCEYSTSPLRVVESGSRASSEGKPSDVSKDDDVIVAPEASGNQNGDGHVDADEDTDEGTADAETGPSTGERETPSVVPAQVVSPAIPGRSVSFNPGIVVDAMAADRIALVTRTSEGGLSLCLKSATEAEWAGDLSCTSIPTVGRVFGQPAVVYASGSLHIMARNDANLISYTVCPPDASTFESCRARRIDVTMSEDVSLVALADGTLMGFVKGYYGEGRLWTFRFRGESLEGLEIERICASPVWNSPTAVVGKDESGREQVSVFYRDNDWFNGHLVAGRWSDGKPWLCQISLDMGDYSLGSVPAAYYNGWTKKYDVIAKEHRPTRLDGYLARWSVNMEGDALSPLEKGGKIADDEALFPFQHRLGLAVFGNGRSDGSVHIVYREQRLGVLRYAVNTDPSHKNSFESFWLNEEEGSMPTRPELAFSTPAIAVDMRGSVHVFARPARSDLGTLRHYFTTVSSRSWLNSSVPSAVFWQSDGLNVPMASDASPVAIVVPSY